MKKCQFDLNLTPDITENLLLVYVQKKKKDKF